MIVDRTVVMLTLRGLLVGRRALALALVAALPVIAAIAGGTGDVEPLLAWARQVQGLILPVVVAFISVVISAGALSDLREDGTILYLVSTPLRRVTLAASLTTAAWLAALVIVVPSVLLAGPIALGGDLTLAAIAWPLLAALLASLAYCALGVWAAMLLRHPVVVGALYILLWEGTFATWTDTAEYFSIGAYARAVAVEGVTRVNAPDIRAGVALIVLLAIGAVATAAAARRLARAELP